MQPGQVNARTILVAHEQTYNGFKVLIRWSMVALASSLTMLTLWFATAAGFFAALVTGVLVFAVGYYSVAGDGARKPLDVDAGPH